MYRNAYQRGLLTILFSGGSKPLEIWEQRTQDGYIERFLDQDINAMVLEIGGTNVSTTYITAPKGKVVLGITMPFLVMIVKNLKKYFSFEVTILDETNSRRRFRVSNFQSSTKIDSLCTVMPIGLSEGWNQIQFNLAEFTRRAYKKQYVETQKLQINANIRIRRVYFAERLLPEDQLPPEYKLYFPLKSSKGKQRIKAKEPTTAAIVERKSEEVATTALTVEETRETEKELEKAESKTAVPQTSKISVHSVKRTPSLASGKDSKDVVMEPEKVISEEKAVVEENIAKDDYQEAVAEEYVAKDDNHESAAANTGEEDITLAEPETASIAGAQIDE